MLNFAEENAKDWPQWLALLLFTVKEAPQTSLDFLHSNYFWGCILMGCWISCERIVRSKPKEANHFAPSSHSSGPHDVARNLDSI